MAGNTFGHVFRLTSFGESHGVAVGGVIDGCPAGLKLDVLAIQNELNRRRPGQSAITTSRNEHDELEILSGVFEGVTTGTPIAFYVKNKDVKSGDYAHLQHAIRPSHADYTYTQKYGVRDYRGGGRSSARETLARVVAGAIAKQLLAHYNVTIFAYVSQVGAEKCTISHQEIDINKIESNVIRCPDEVAAQKMINLIEQIKQEGDTIGGVVTCVIKNCPKGIGEPVFDKLHAELGKAMLSINAVKGFEYGSGFDAVEMKGSEHNDVFIHTENSIQTKTNYSGGIQGGISNGEDIYFRVAFKPVATIMKNQVSVDLEGNEQNLEGKGRHDPCVVPRAVPIVEAMAAMVLIDYILLNKTVKLTS
jgi:chorismate synthase